jgi:hypothetical protein
MALARSESGRKADQSDHNKDDRPGVAELEVAAAHFCQQKKHADSYHDDGPNDVADGATMAAATNTIAHL